jgi:putative transposase
MSAEAVRAASLAARTALIEGASGAELSHHPGHRSGATKPEDADNHRKVTSGNTVLTQHDPLRAE